MTSDEAGGKPVEGGWTPEEKGQGSPGGAGGGSPGDAGEPKSKGRPTDDRAKMEEAAAETQKESGEGQPS
ncbi:hypothetical protein GCM10009416_20050 [Craurococcus roseus]|uniref:Uncharacterized protein n=1 Tax=Craurococcus roseus TaxID=77585 RepID=A0ABN1F3P0_9PROT